MKSEIRITLSRMSRNQSNSLKERKENYQNWKLKVELRIASQFKPLYHVWENEVYFISLASRLGLSMIWVSKYLGKAKAQCGKDPEVLPFRIRY